MQSNRINFEAIGTHWYIQIDELIDTQSWSNLQQRIHERIEEFDQSYSRFRNDSLISRISRASGTYPLPADSFKLLHFYERLYHLTNGKVTPLIGQTLSDAGYDASYSLKSKALKPTPKWEDVLINNFYSITTRQPVLLDFGAAGKGYLVDIVGELIEKEGMRSYVINAGGDIRHRSRNNESVTVGLENPMNTSEVIGTVEITNQSICSSAGNKRRWNNFHHIIDPVTQQSPEEIIANWVIADSTMLADGIATALFFTHPQELMGELDFTYAVIKGEMQIEYAKDFPVSLL